MEVKNNISFKAHIVTDVKTRKKKKHVIEQIKHEPY